MVINQGLPAPAPVGESVPNTAPRGGKGVAAIAAGAYTSIISVVGLSEAYAGDQLTLQVVVQNLASYGIYIAITGSYDGITAVPSPDYLAVDAGATEMFTLTITMPNKDITVDIYSFYWTGTEWYQDDHRAVTIKLKTLTPQFSGFDMSDYSRV